MRLNSRQLASSAASGASGAIAASLIIGGMVPGLQQYYVPVLRPPPRRLLMAR